MPMPFTRFVADLLPSVSMIVLATAVSTVSAGAETSIPDDWFFSGKDRPKKLRELEGKEAPEIAIKEWIGDSTSVADARGKVVIVDFWATWCGPCMASIPHNVELVKKHGDDGLVFIGVHDGSSGWDKAAGVVRDKSINYSVGRDDGESVKRFNLSFWPTYVAIDKHGTVRAAGLMPDRVDDVVEMLLAEPGPAGVAAAASATPANPPAWYYGGAARPSWLRAVEGKPAPVPSLNRWRGDAVPESDRAGRVVVMHFFVPDSELAMRQLVELSKLAEALGPQGATFIGVCDARADWEKAKAALDAGAVTLPVAQDAPTPATPPSGAIVAATTPPAAMPTPPEGAVQGAPPATAIPTIARPIALGATASALGVRLSPMTVVIDRAGVVRAAGVRPDKVKEIVNKLLAEPTPTKKS